MRDLTLTALMTAVLCVLAPVSIPIGPVPISLATFIIYLSIYILGTARSALCVVLYLLIGLAGVPVFSGYSAGPAKLLGPTGGYLIGYIPMVLIAGFFIEKSGMKLVGSIAGMIAGTAVLYLIGTVVLAVSAHLAPGAAISAGVLPFIPLDLVKICASALIGPSAARALRKAGLIGVRNTI